MALPEVDVARAKRWVDRHNAAVPPRADDLVRYELDVADRHLTLMECRPPWREDYGPDWTRFPIVRFRYTRARNEWATIWRDRNSKFHRYELLPATPTLDELLEAVDDDRSGIFWG